MITLIRLLRLLGKYRWRLVQFFIISLIYSAFHNSFAVVCKSIGDVLEGNVPGWMLVNSSKQALTGIILADKFPLWIIDAKQALGLIILAGGILLLGKCLFQYIRRYLQSWLSRKVVIDTQNDVAAHLLTLDLGYFQRSRTGEIVSRLTNDMRMLSRTATLFCQLISGPITLLGGLIYVFILKWQLALLSLVAVPVTIGILRSLSWKMRKASKRAFEKQADATNILLQFLNGIRTVKAFGCEEKEKTGFRNEMRSVFNIGMKGARARARVRPMVELMAGFGLLLVLYVGGIWKLGGTLSLGELMGFGTALGLMYMPAKDFSQANSEVQETLPAAERVFEIFNERPEVKDAPDAIAMPGFEKEIRLAGVNFSYVKDTPVLKDINLTVPRGSRVALVGPSGAGKSTLVDLVARFHDPQAGAITVDGHDLRKLKLQSLLANIAIVSQDPFLFNISIRENIAYGRSDAGEEEIINAARAAAIHEEILALPESYDTNAGERGDLLSGGQRQRICIARAILKNAPILILDEATSSLDTENERLVQTALEHLMQNRTTLVIAHRLSTIRHADLVVVLSNGRIVAAGTHDELLSQGGIYANLWAMQSGDGDWGKDT
ncbi:MAG: ABC transporter ATP-binding protein [Planctomycetes bacterium]|nr:ABC transporter ATP-binding protein [Planctomycetota bacterium]